MDASRRGIYDAALMGILSNEGQIYPFLDAIFDFLYRRTDFYHIKSSPSDKLGFNPGVARRIVRAAFESYHKLADEAQKKKDAAARVVTQTEEPVPIAAEVEVETTTSGRYDRIDNERKRGGGTSGDRPRGRKVKVPVLAERPSSKATPESYNGAMRDNYCWSQSIHDIDVRVKVAPDVTSRNQVRVTIGTNHLKVELLDLTTKSVVRARDHVLINLEKATELWWERLLVNEPKINIPCHRPNQAAGRKTPQEEKVENLLREAWDKDGSPFKGQPFDPSIINMSGVNSDV
ncbi:hypothetical protein MRX96_021820 [Rhipicephalus microplus]